MPLYFAYGSNLKVERLTERIGSVERAGIALLPDHALSFAKRGGDGSGKACCLPAAGERVFGALYELHDAQFALLDRFERGYRRTRVELLRPEGATVGGVTYHAERFTDDPVPFDWYKQLLVEGAREHGLPDDWQALLATITSRPGPPER